MKTIKLFITATILFTLSTNAQITKGNWMVGGNAIFSSNEEFSKKNDEKYNSQTIQISPNIGYFIVNRLSVGAKIGYEGQFVSYASGFNYNSISYGAFSRYYFFKQEKIVNLFLEGAYVQSQRKYSGDQYDTLKENTFYIMAGPNVFFNSSVALELILKYSSTINNDDNGVNRFQVGLGFQIFLENK